MNYFLIASGILAILMVIVHSIVGEILILMPLRKSTDLPVVRGSSKNTKMTLRFTWHVTSVIGTGIACILFYYSQFPELANEQHIVLRIISVTLFLSFIVSIVGSRARHPSWIVFLIISILTWIGTIWT